MHSVLRALAGALILLASSGCRAERPDHLTHEIVSVPFDGRRPHDNPNAPYNALIQRLRERAAAEARDEGSDAVVSTTHWGPLGERMLIAAITPRRGVFYFSEYGPYAAGGGATVMTAREAIDVCRFTIIWDRLPGGAYAPGLAWAGLAFPDIDCRPPPGSHLATLGDWRRNSERASYAVATTERRPGLVAALVQESWPGDGAPQPLDAARALAAVTGRDPVVRAIPLSEDQPLYAVTAAGRTFIGITNSYEAAIGRRICVVEGLSWAQIAARDDRQLAAARDLCARLFQSSRALRR